jgi:prepilin-type N-terminal cleavage/methylation domain-containing protein
MRTRTDRESGMTLIEMIVAMLIMAALLAGFSFMYLAYSRSGEGTTQLTASQGSTRTVVRVLEADLRSADPLELPGTVSLGSLTPPGAGDQDYLVMFEPTDAFAPCKTTPVPPAVPSGSLPVVLVPAPNVVWSYSKATGVLTRWSYVNCGSGAQWRAGMTLRNIVDAAGTMFLLTGTGSQVPSIPTGETGQAAVAVCATGVKIRIQTSTKSQTTPFKLDVTVPLPNETSVEGQACN